MPKFTIKSSFKPAGDQPKAIETLAKNARNGAPEQTLVGVTGSGKTFTIANVIERAQKPTLVISHNKTLAYQLYQEFKEFFPENSVHYFVSYYDYYQPEAYIPQTDTYIDKDVKINEELDRLRHEATQAILSRDDVVVVASVSCIYNIGSPANYEKISIALSHGQAIPQKEFLKHLVSLQYQRNEIEKMPGIFRHKGEIVEIYPSTGTEVIKIIFGKNAVEKILVSPDPQRALWREQETIKIFPAKFWLSDQKIIPLAAANIKNELARQVARFKKEGKLLEAQRIEQRTNFDLEMLKSTGYCHGIENYSRHMEFRKPDSPPYTLIDYFTHRYGQNFLTVVDESHMTIPQIRGMYHGDRARKNTLIKYGFRLPSALDNRPLRFHEYAKRVPQTIYMSATPAEYEIKQSGEYVAEQLIRPTGLLDPKISVRKSENQIKDAILEIEKRAAKKQRALVTVLTKRMAEDLADYLKEEDIHPVRNSPPKGPSGAHSAGVISNRIKAHYLHSEVKTLDRAETLRNLRLGEYDVIVGVNLLREGLDLPEVSLVVIMDADKEGFLRNKTTLIQTMGRAARHLEGEVIMYADKMTQSMKSAIAETDRRRKIQETYNKKHGITPRQIEKLIREREKTSAAEKYSLKEMEEISPALLAETTNVKKLIADYTQEMKKAAKELDFAKAQKYKNIIQRLKKYR